ncbi:hypothetical protein DFH09DRAFT_222117 [Mycena vulgaris]|nr:hypothetical protein DFH09DRAFT_222117 [Mycena vulgaris]
MSQINHPAKSSSPECSPEECKRVPDLWFPDANLIFRAENTLFRVHGGILAARSTVFGDMVTVPQPAHPDGQTLDGHPIVYLHDSAAEVEVFLRAMFDSNFFMPAPSPTHFSTAIGVMRLAHKYDVPYLFRRALRHLDSVYPTTLADFIGAHIAKTAVPHVRFMEGDGDVADDLVTARAASDVGALWLLPTTYYFLCCRAVEDLYSAREAWGALRADEVRTCLTSQAALIRATNRSYRFLRRIPSPHCPSKEICLLEVSRTQDFLEAISDLKVDAHPLGPSFFRHPSLKLCSDCRQLGEEQFTEAQESFWRGLPGIFGLPDWDELYKMRGEVLEVEP